MVLLIPLSRKLPFILLSIKLPSSVLEKEREIYKHQAKGTGKPDPVVQKIADGRIYSGKQAKENGLVDELGGLDDAIKEAAKLSQITDYTVVEYSRPVSLSEKFLQFKTNINLLGVNLDLKKAQDAKPSLKYQWSIN